MKHPDKVKEVELTCEDAVVTLVLECETQDLADTIYEMLARQLRNGNLDLRGSGGQATDIQETREVPR